MENWGMTKGAKKTMQMLLKLEKKSKIAGVNKTFGYRVQRVFTWAGMGPMNGKERCQGIGKSW